MPEPLSEIQNSSSPRERVSVTHTCVEPPCRTALAVASEMICEISCTIQQGTSMRSEEHTSELQSLMRISYAVFCLKKKKKHHHNHTHIYNTNITQYISSYTQHN